MMQPGFLTWQQAHETGATQCGGKGWNLARLHRFGFNVPNGGVLTGDVYEQLLADPAFQTLVIHLRTTADDRLSGSDTAQQLETLRQMIVTRGIACAVYATAHKIPCGAGARGYHWLCVPVQHWKMVKALHLPVSMKVT